MPSLSVVVVTYESRDDVGRSLPPLVGELREGDELIVVDNGSSDGTGDAIAELAPTAKLIRNARNEGFSGGCNRGAAAASGDLLLLLNPDADVQPGFREAILRPLAQARGWAAWMGLVTRDRGALINTEGNVVHFAGFSWAGGDGRPVEEAAGEAREVGCLSGTSIAIPRASWERLGGFPAEFFSYCEDTDLSLRLRLEGGALGVEPAARVDHRYAFSKPGLEKWRNLERNRWATLVRTYPGALLALVFPALLATELALIPVSIAGGWASAKLRANLDLVRWLPRLARERRRVQATRRVSAAEFARGLSADLGSEYLGRAGRSRVLGWGLRAYWSLVLALLGARSRSSELSPDPEPAAVPSESGRERSS